MATSPNFSWPEPDNTDLVKNGALAIRTLGDAIDSSMADLKGGTTGQVLKKNSNTDMDFVWSADSAGMTNPMTTTGDTIYSSSGSTPARLGIGSTGQVLTVSGGVPTWSTPAAAGLSPYVYAYRSTAINLTNNSYVELVFNGESFDSDSCYNTTNGRFTPTTAGKYFVATNLIFDAAGIDRWGAGYNVIRKNGSNVSTAYTDNYDNYTMYTVTIPNNAIVECNGTTDYISTFYYSSITTGTMQMMAGSCMTIFKVG